MDHKRNEKKLNKENIEAKEKATLRMLSKRMLPALLISILVFTSLIGRLFWIEIVKGAEYKESAYKQQTLNRIISPKRGTIYDATGKALAMSSRVDTISINPGKILYSNDKDVETEKVARALADIFELDYNEVLEKVTAEASVKTIAKKVEQEKVNQLKEWMKENKVTSGINIDEDSKRSYPYGNLASNLVGFCGADNQGLVGLEYTWEDILTGTPGKIVTTSNVVRTRNT